MKNLLLHSLVFAVLTLSQSCFGQAPPPAPEPTKEQVWLQKFVGQWKTESKGVAGPDQPPMQCSGTLSSRMLGGFWVVNEMSGDMAGVPMTGIQTIGFDAEKKKYIGTWVDSMTAFMWKYEGSVDATGKVLTLQADGPNFVAEGKLTTFEDIYEFTTDDKITMTSRMLIKEGEWVTFMTGTATRVK